MLRKPWLIMVLFAVVPALFFGWACGNGNGGNDGEFPCDDGIDNDGDGLTDCRDDDCQNFLGCVDGDADGDVDGDGDADGDVDGDVDGDADGDGDGDVPCDSPCETSELFDDCYMGDCTDDPDVTAECCVADDTTCHTVLTVGSMYAGLEIDYRGFYSNDHRCTMEVIDSLGHDTFSFMVQTRGIACEYGFIRVTVRGRLDDVAVDTTYPLCGDGMPDSLEVNVTIGESTTEQTVYTNQGCTEDFGSFVLTAIGTTTGDAYAFALDGVLKADGEPTGESAVIAITSDGILEYATE